MSTAAGNFDFTRTTVVRSPAKKPVSSKTAPLPRAYESGMVEEKPVRPYNWFQRQCLKAWGLVTAREIA